MKAIRLFVLGLLLVGFDTIPSLPSNPPFNAWVTSEIAYVRRDFDHIYGNSVAILEYGDIVRVVECRPSCTDSNAWARLEPLGVIRLADLGPLPRTRSAEFLSSGVPNFTWARVIRSADIHSEPRENSEVIGNLDHGDEVVFRPGVRNGYLERPMGGFVRLNDLHVFTPSPFSGWVNPPERFAFVNRDTTLTVDGTTQPVYRYERFAVLSEDNSTVSTPQGTIPSRDVRLGFHRPRPSNIPPHVRWVHVDLEQQVLTAYEMNNEMIFATLVSTGRRNGSTPRGTWQVRRIITFTRMKGGGATGRPYNVEGVAYTQYLNNPTGAIALHSAYWHDRFGNVMSHGCINLSLSDARYLYDFSPTQPPANWHSLSLINANLNRLWVVIE
jgi:hypothetical protein